MGGESVMAGVVIQEWFEERGGAERVVDALIEALPGADFACLWADVMPPGVSSVRESFLARTPLRRHKALALPLMPAVWTRFPKGSYDWAFVSSHAFAHQTRVKADRKISYVYTPARYIWEPDLDGRGLSLLGRAGAGPLRAIDRARSRHAGELYGCSEFVVERIRRVWGLDAGVLYPPVDVAALQAVPDWSVQLDPSELAILERLPSQFVVGASRLVPYKALDTVIEVGTALDVPVVIMGDGPERQRLEAMGRAASVPVEFLGAVSDALLRAVIQRAAVFIFPAIEDFGIIPVEAMALGTPVLVPHVGGAAESLRLVGLGASVNFADTAEVIAGFEAALGADQAAARRAVQAFDRGAFVLGIRELIARGS